MHWILLTKELPVEEGKKNFEPHHTCFDPSLNQKRIGHHYCLLQGKAGRTCQESSHHSLGYQMVDASPVMPKKSIQYK